MQLSPIDAASRTWAKFHTLLPVPTFAVSCTWASSAVQLMEWHSCSRHNCTRVLTFTILQQALWSALRVGRHIDMGCSYSRLTVDMADSVGILEVREPVPRE